MGLFVLGLLLGMGHALEADHLLSVKSMVNHRMSIKRITFLGIFWGLGHTFTLLLIVSLVVLFNLVISGSWGYVLEFLVGVVLVILGLDVIRKIRKNRMHFHVHRHRDGVGHLQAQDSYFHSNSKNVIPIHNYRHPQSSWGERMKSFLVGLLHGGASALPLLTIVLIVSEDHLTKLLYVLFFGLGSLIGMSLLTSTLSWPIKKLSRLMDRRFAHFYQALQYTFPLLTIGFGIFIITQSGQHLF